ncbi:MAG: MgtC/SapB family protein [Flavobacteriales bacterium]|nr:MgtC/SapB family protein [Flavobacteriales bacterium]MBL7984693.1 MgtC/SapB family protein [Flavobacteriales bacterium]
MDIQEELVIASKLLIAAVLGAVVGYDRERHSRDAGLRTYASVCVGAALFTSIGGHLEDVAATSRIVANVVMGIGFLGAGIVYKDANSGYSKGLTTAATIWCTAAIGVAVGLNMFVIAAAGALLVYFLISLHHRTWYVRWKQRIKDSTNNND